MKNIHLLIFSLSYVIVLQSIPYTNNKTNSKEEKVLEKQLLRAHSISNEVTTIRYYPYDKEDLEVSITLFDSILKENEYTRYDPGIAPHRLDPSCERDGGVNVFDLPA